MTSPFQQLVSQANAQVIVNDALDVLGAIAVYGRNMMTTSALVWGSLGGRFGGTAIVAGTLTLSDNTANYLVVAQATGVQSVSSSNTNWNDATNYLRVYKVTTSSGVVTAVEDHRFGAKGIIGGGGGGGTSDDSGAHRSWMNI